MAKKVTRIKAKDTPVKAEKSVKDTPVKAKKPAQDAPIEAKKSAKGVVTEVKKPARQAVSKQKAGKKKVFILFRPFVALGRYLRDSWREIRQVRWPNGKATWKMLLAVVIYSAIFILIITLLDLFFGWLFGLILGK